MPTRDRAENGSPCWIDLFTTDPAASQAFYGDLFGWTSEVGGEEYGGYIAFALGGVPVAGAMQNDGSTGAPDGWSIYLATDDVEKTAATATDNDGTVLMPPMVIPAQGSMAMLSDPTGAVIGLWQANGHAGFGVIAEPGAPSWFELFTRDHPAALEFYRSTFGWDVHVAGDSDEFRYATKGEGDAAEAGIMDAAAWLPDGVPAHWSVYFGTANADETVALAITLGGAVVAPAEDTPYGRLATLSDVTGAVFKLIQP